MKKIFLLAVTLCACFIAQPTVESDALDVNRISGTDRYKTAVEISKSNYKSANTVILASGEGFADALAGGQLSIAKNAPILLTKANKLDNSVKEEIQRLGAREVIILGGENSVSYEIEHSIKANTLRLAGKDRYETSLKLAKESYINANDVVLASGNTYADALAAVSISNNKKAPILLVGKNNASNDILDFIKYTKVNIVGGIGSISKELEINISSISTEFRDKSVDPTIVESPDDFTDYTYNLANREITGLKANKKYLVIPSEINGVKIKSISKNAFYNKELNSVIISPGIENIGVSSFEMISIKELKLPNTIKSIGGRAFAWNQIESLIIPNSVVNIDTMAFDGNHLNKLDLGTGVKVIGESAFQVNQIKDLRLPNSVQKIGNFAFSDNVIVKLEIPSNVTSIGESSFEGNNISDLKLNEGIVSIGEYAFRNNFLENVVVPKKTKEIYASSFAEQRSIGGLKTIKVPLETNVTGNFADFGSINVILY